MLKAKRQNSDAGKAQRAITKKDMSEIMRMITRTGPRSYFTKPRGKVLVKRGLKKNMDIKKKPKKK